MTNNAEKSAALASTTTRKVRPSGFAGTGAAEGAVGAATRATRFAGSAVMGPGADHSTSTSPSAAAGGEEGRAGSGMIRVPRTAVLSMSASGATGSAAAARDGATGVAASSSATLAPAPEGASTPGGRSTCVTSAMRSAMRRSSRANSSALWKRASGRFAIALSTAASSSSSKGCGTALAGACGASRRWAFKRSSTLSACAKGLRPASSV